MNRKERRTWKIAEIFRFHRKFNHDSKVVYLTIKLLYTNSESSISLQLSNKYKTWSAIYVLPFDIRNYLYSYRFIIEWIFLFCICWRIYLQDIVSFDLTFLSFTMTAITIYLHKMNGYVWHYIYTETISISRNIVRYYIHSWILGKINIHSIVLNEFKFHSKVW